jgi:hypothetical protein
LMGAAVLINTVLVNTLVFLLALPFRRRES